VPWVAVRWQIVQKLHACTETFEVGENDRFRDLIDLPLLGDLVADGQWTEVRAACVEVFARRAKHVWPPAVTVNPPWEAGYALSPRTRASPS